MPQQLPLPLCFTPPANDNAPPTRVEPEAFRRRVIQAIQERRVCRIVYVGPDEVARARDVEPYAIIRVDSHWTVFGFCRLRQNLRTFRSDRVVALDVLSDAFTPRPSVSLERFILRRRGAA